MTVQDEPDDRVSNEEDAELHALRRIASAFERGDVDELAAALYRMIDEAEPEPQSRERPKKNNSLWAL
jgi:hypothetical protein